MVWFLQTTFVRMRISVCFLPKYLSTFDLEVRHHCVGTKNRVGWVIVNMAIFSGQIKVLGALLTNKARWTNCAVIAYLSIWYLYLKQLQILLRVLSSSCGYQSKYVNIQLLFETDSYSCGALRILFEYYYQFYSRRIIERHWHHNEMQTRSNDKILHNFPIALFPLIHDKNIDIDKI